MAFKAPSPAIAQVYKITRPNRMTYNDFVWSPGQWYEFPGRGPLCGPGWAHFYLSPQLAVLLNPLHANYEPYTLWAAEGVIGVRDYNLKVGCSRARLVRKISVPAVTLTQRVTFAIFCALTVCDEAQFVCWAEDWLSGQMRTQDAAKKAVDWATQAAARAATRGEAWAAEAALTAARAARGGARAEAWAVEAWAAEAALTAARAAKRPSTRDLDLVQLASAALVPWEPS